MDPEIKAGISTRRNDPYILFTSDVGNNNKGRGVG